MAEYICSECGNFCRGIWVDFGIGPYEFWGAKSFHTDNHFVSDCCEATMHDEDGKEIDYDDQDD